MRQIGFKKGRGNCLTDKLFFNRGVFLSCLIYSEDKILVTVDDILPTLSIDEDQGTSFNQDFHWLHKLSCVWNDTKFLKHEMDKCDSASTLHFRSKLIQAVTTMQVKQIGKCVCRCLLVSLNFWMLMQGLLELNDLGKVYYKPITMDNTVTFICTINHLRSTKLASAPNVRWIPVDKFKGKKPVNDKYKYLMDSFQVFTMSCWDSLLLLAQRYGY